MKPSNFEFPCLHQTTYTIAVHSGAPGIPILKIESVVTVHMIIHDELQVEKISPVYGNFSAIEFYCAHLTQEAF